MQTDHQIPGRRLDLITGYLRNFAVPVGHRLKIKGSERKDNYWEITRELKNPAEHESDGDISCSWCTWNGTQRLGKETIGTGNQRKNRDQLEHNIIKIG